MPEISPPAAHAKSAICGRFVRGDRDDPGLLDVALRLPRPVLLARHEHQALELRHQHAVLVEDADGAAVELGLGRAYPAPRSRRTPCAVGDRCGVLELSVWRLAIALPLMCTGVRGLDGDSGRDVGSAVRLTSANAQRDGTTGVAHVGIRPLSRYDHPNLQLDAWPPNRQPVAAGEAARSVAADAGELGPPVAAGLALGAGPVCRPFGIGPLRDSAAESNRWCHVGWAGSVDAARTCSLRIRDRRGAASPARIEDQVVVCGTACSPRWRTRTCRQRGWIRAPACDLALPR